MLAAACTPLCLGAAAAAGAQLNILTVQTSADRQVTVVADVQPAGATPIGSESFTVTAGDARLPTRVEPMLSDQLAIGLVVDGSRQAAATLHNGVSGPANLLLQVPVAARVAAIADTSPPAVLAPLAVGAKAALSALDTLRPDGRRHTSQALTVALQQLPVTPGEPRLVVLYTGAADAGGEPATDLAERLHDAHTLLAVVSTAADSSFWSQVTAATGGVLVPAQASDPISTSEVLLDRLAGRYLLTFTAPERLPGRVSVQVDTPAGTASADAFVARGSTPDGPGDSGAAGLPLPALTAAALVLFGAAAVLRTRWAAQSRSAGRAAAGNGRRRSIARPSPPPVRSSPRPRRAMPAAEAAATSAARGAAEPVPPLRPRAAAPPNPPAAAPDSVAPPAGEAAVTSAAGVPEPLHPVPPPAAAAPRPAPVPVPPAAVEAARPSAARGVPDPMHPPPPPATALPQRARAPAQAATAASAQYGKDAGRTEPLTDDGPYADLDTQVGTAAAAVGSGRLDPQRAVAQIALVAPGRIDLLDRIMEAWQQTAGSEQANRPPAETALELVESARRVITGEATLTGPDGVRVEQTVPAGADPLTRTVLRLTRNGRWECDCRTAEELGRHVDVSKLVAGPNATLRSTDPEQ